MLVDAVRGWRGKLGLMNGTGNHGGRVCWNWGRGIRGLGRGFRKPRLGGIRLKRLRILNASRSSVRVYIIARLLSLILGHWCGYIWVLIVPMLRHLDQGQR